MEQPGGSQPRGSRDEGTFGIGLEGHFGLGEVGTMHAAFRHPRCVPHPSSSRRFTTDSGPRPFFKPRSTSNLKEDT